MDKCPCGSSKFFDQCCGPLLRGDRYAATSEELMRSRYTAYSKGRVKYIEKTMRGKVLQGFDRKEAIQWVKAVKFINLRILNAALPAPDDNIGFVEFCAKFSFNGKEQCLHEISEFHKEDGQWFYVDGVILTTGR